MNNEFIKQTTNFLSNSGIDTKFIDTRMVEMSFKDGIISPKLKITFFDTVIFGGGSPDISNNIILQIIIVFSMLDAKIDTDYPNLQGLSFKKKLEGLPENTDNEKIVKTFFRILKTLRNASIHSMSNISFINNRIAANYSFQNTNFSIDISKEFLRYVILFLINFLSPNLLYTKKHNLEFNISLFKKAMTEIAVFKDEFTEPLNTKTTDKGLKYSVRYLVENATCEIEKDKLIITSLYDVADSEKAYSGVDYRVILPDKGSCLIPGEYLDSEKSINISGLSDWVL